MPSRRRQDDDDDDDDDDQDDTDAGTDLDRRRDKKRRKKEANRTVAALILIGCGILMCSAAIVGRFMWEMSPAKPVETITANDLCTQFFFNVAAAETKYMNKRITVNGKVSDIIRDVEDVNKFRVILETNINGERWIVICVSTQSEAAKTAKGEAASVTGTVGGMGKGKGVFLENCTVK